MALLRLTLEQPQLTLKECGERVGYSPWQVSRIVNSPEFVARMKEAQETLIQKAMEASTRRLFAPPRGG